MGRLIKVIFDPLYKPKQLEVPIAEPTEEQIEHGYEIKKHEHDQAKVYGVQVPMIAINDIFIDFDNVIDFSLKSVDVFPTLKMTLMDKYGLIESIQTPGMDNSVRVDILPKFENAYKKIELDFYINNLSIRGNCLTLTCLYKYPKLTDARFEALGEVNTYDLFYNIAKKTELGFATNVLKYDDKRYMYCDYKSYINLLSREIATGGNENAIYNFWIDFWNYIVLQDTKERYYTIDSDEELMLWVAKQSFETQEDIEIEAIKTVALITNHPAAGTSELYIDHYDLLTNSGDQMNNGSDRVYSIYEESKREHRDYNVIDGDAKKDVFVNFDYIGENYAEHNYLKQKCLRNAFFQKVNSEGIKITLNTPLLGLNRGDKMNFIWYVNDSAKYERLAELEDIKVIYPYEDIDINIPIPDSKEGVENPDNGIPIVDRAISGQYLITGTELEYSDQRWKYNLILRRPADQKPKILREE